MRRRTAAAALGLYLAALSVEAGATPLDRTPEICARNAEWVDDNAAETGREFDEAFGEFDGRFTAFSERLSDALRAGDGPPEATAIVGLRTAIADVYRALARLIPMRAAGNHAWPMKLLLEEIPGGVRLPDFDPPDREQVLRAAFLRALVTVPLPGQERSKVRFLARLDMARALLDADTGSSTDVDALRVLANGALAEAYDADFRKPALRVLGDGWHTSLAGRLKREVQRMCSEAAG